MQRGRTGCSRSAAAGQEPVPAIDQRISDQRQPGSKVARSEHRLHRIRAMPQQPARFGRNGAAPRGRESRGGQTWDMGVDAAEWADRAGVVEEVIRRRFLRRLLGVVPGTRIGRVRWPRPVLVRPWPWHYWWQAHLLDCLVDAQRRAPNPVRAMEIAALARTVRLRNFGSWTNDYYDDIAWFGLAVQRAGPLARRSTPSALAAITTRLQAGWTARRGRGDLVAPRGQLQERPGQRPRGDPGRPRRERRVRRGDHRLDDHHAGRPGIRSGPRRSSLEPRRIDPKRSKR